MNVFITGATGFIGKRLIELIEKDTRFENIYCLCRKETAFSSNIKIITGSLEDLHKLPPVKADICLHLAAVTDSASSDKRDIFRINAEGTEQVVEFCKRSGIPEIVFLSSVNVYLKKKYSYALSKLSAEDCIKNSGLDYSVLRCTHVYGPGCPSFDKILRFADIFHMIPVLGSGTSYKQPIYIDEICNEIISHTFSAKENTVCDVYGKTKMTYNEMLRAILRAANKKALILHLPSAPFLLLSELCYKFNLPFPVYPEQISHMREDLCAKEALSSSDLAEFNDNLRKYIN